MSPITKGAQSPSQMRRLAFSLELHFGLWIHPHTHTCPHAYVYLCICMDIWIYRVAVWDDSMKRVSLQSAKLVAAFCWCSPFLLVCSSPSLPSPSRFFLRLPFRLQFQNTFSIHFSFLISMEAILLPPHRIAGRNRSRSWSWSWSWSWRTQPRRHCFGPPFCSASVLLSVASGARDSVNLVIFHDVLIMQQQPQQPPQLVVVLADTL